VSVVVREPTVCAAVSGSACLVDLGARITVADWCGAAAPGSTVVLATPHLIKAGQGVDGPPVSLLGLSVPVPSGKQVRSITLPDDPRLRLYAVTLT
jgi:hypothetical protein